MMMLAPFLFMSLELRAPSKVNLLLNVLGPRPDGFHELETVIYPLPLADGLSFARIARGLEFTCTEPTLPTDRSNLVVCAAQTFLQHAAMTEGVRLRLEKRIPLAAGLGGGSSDAATTLLGLNRLFGDPLQAEALGQLAATLGSDVPFFLQAAPALATGRGERIAPLEWFGALDQLWLLLIHPGFGVPTAWAYQNLARFPVALHGQPGRAARLIARLRAGDLTASAAEFYNSLEAPVLSKFPILAMYQEHLRSEGALATLMSGSGSTTFAVVPDEAAGQGLRERFLAKFGAECWTALVPLGRGDAPAAASGNIRGCQAGFP
jgi:4-diphosphocytidyl-2-C-methyl-D-erythritol kinase